MPIPLSLAITICEGRPNSWSRRPMTLRSNYALSLLARADTTSSESEDNQWQRVSLPITYLKIEISKVDNQCEWRQRDFGNVGYDKDGRFTSLIDGVRKHVLILCNWHLMKLDSSLIVVPMHQIEQDNISSMQFNHIRANISIDYTLNSRGTVVRFSGHPGNPGRGCVSAWRSIAAICRHSLIYILLSICSGFQWINTSIL